MIGVPTSSPASSMPTLIRSRIGSSQRSSSKASAWAGSRSDGRERLGRVELELLVVVDPTPVLPVQRLDRVVTFGGSHGLHHPEQAVGALRRVVVRAVGLGFVLEEQADRLPGDRQVSVGRHFVDDPTGRHPTPRSYGVDPVLDVHVRLLRRPECIGVAPSDRSDALGGHRGRAYDRPREHLPPPAPVRARSRPDRVPFPRDRRRQHRRPGRPDLPARSTRRR